MTFGVILSYLNCLFFYIEGPLTIVVIRKLDVIRVENTLTLGIVSFQQYYTERKVDYSSTAVFTFSKLFSLLLVVDTVQGDWLEVSKRDMD